MIGQYFYCAFAIGDEEYRRRLFLFSYIFAAEEHETFYSDRNQIGLIER